jgi:hypothetical protein
MRTKTKATLGAAAATGAALAAAYYLYGSDKASEHRRQVKKWAQSAEREIVQAARKAKDKALSDRNIRTLITEAAHRYRMTKHIDPKEVRDFIADMQGKWHSVQKALGGTPVAKKKVPRARQRKPRAKSS